MMTGIEHYREAERLMPRRILEQSEQIAAAQVHATLALVALIAMAMVDAAHEDGTDNAEVRAWAQELEVSEHDDEVH